MPKRPRPLVEFNARIYTYPSSIAWGIPANPIQIALSHREIEKRRHWLSVAIRSRSNYHKMIGEPFADPSDKQILCSLLTEHGIFVEKFFLRSIRERVIHQFAESQIDLHDFQKLLSSALGYEFRIYRESEAISQIIHSIFDQTVLHSVSQPQAYRQLETWFKEFRQPQTCTFCGKEFRVIDLPGWIYFGSNGFKFCCFQCPIVGSPRKKELFSLIPSFVDACGFIPNASASPINHAFTTRLSTDQWPQVFRTYANMGGIEHVKKKFGSWFKALAQTGALPDGTLTTARGIRCLAQDGHVCHSLDEQCIDDWLSAHGLAHEREPCYPVHPALNPTGRRRADWKVLDTFIEYFGLVGDPDYDKRMEEKILLAQHCRINLIAIYPSDLQHLDKRLQCLLDT